ncbi:prolyl oligopeptidase family serine peptidase [Embleya sp. NBC_00896]|uniref:S9 family peptidase n=1 Tax=Embleya sp. NBC_00896 TaxID=2975961 RepID=UPI002F91B321|nr:prolyl oligopeptidase family serine peptidase [Embleya sp. NBC_00896]
MSTISLPRQFIRTRRFTLGVPSAITVAPNGASVLFLRGRSGDDPAACLWVLDLDPAPAPAPDSDSDPDPAPDSAPDRAAERLLVDPAELRTDAGITAYATDDAFTLAAFALPSGLWVVDVATGRVRRLPAKGPVLDPRPDPTGRRIAYVAGGTLRVIEADGSADREVAGPDDGDRPDVRFGVAEYAASASINRSRGYWWSPDGTRLLVARVDESAVPLWHIADPADPARPPRTVRYPAAGTTNADVGLWLVALDGKRIEVPWDRAAFEYLTAAGWDAHGPFAAVQTRDQRTVHTLAVDPDDGRTRLLAERRDPHWVHLLPGTPARTATGALIGHADTPGARRLTVDGVAVTPPGLHVREVLGVDGDDVLFTASTDPTEAHLWTYRKGEATPLDTEPGVHTGVQRGATLVHVARTPDRPGSRTTVLRPDRPAVTIESHGAQPVLGLRSIDLTTTARQLRSRLLLPSWYRAGDPRLPVLVDPYAGPALQRVTANQGPMQFVSQWFAERGFAVLITDGRGTPGRGPAWEREVSGDILGPVLDDQVDALRETVRRHPELDPGRVAVRGWSFSGTLAVAAVLRHPDVFHAAIAGAGLSDQRLYDTHWRERFLGHPDEHPQRYDACSPLASAAQLTRPLLLIHGLADDNVFPANTLRLSAELLAAGRPHEVLPLTGTGHAPADEHVFENLLLHQLDFLRRHLGIATR